MFRLAFRQSLLALLFVAPCVAQDHNTPPQAPGSDPRGEQALADYCASPSLSAEARHSVDVLLAYTKATDCRAMYNTLLSAPRNMLLLGNKGLSDATVFGLLPRLVYVDLGGNQISDPTPLLSLPTLNFLSLYGNRLTDLRPFAGLPFGLRLGGNAVAPGQPECPTGTGNRDLDHFCFDALAFDAAFQGAAPEAALATETLAPLLAALIPHPDLAMYYHGDELPERFPLPVYLQGQALPKGLAVELPGIPVKFVKRPGRNVLGLIVDRRGSRAVVEVAYPPEGVTGTLRMQLAETGWQVVHAQVFE